MNGSAKGESEDTVYVRGNAADVDKAVKDIHRIVEGAKNDGIDNNYASIISATAFNILIFTPIRRPNLTSLVTMLVELSELVDLRSTSSEMISVLNSISLTKVMRKRKTAVKRKKRLQRALSPWSRL
jgi:hypothetical protein